MTHDHSSLTPSSLLQTSLRSWEALAERPYGLVYCRPIASRDAFLRGSVNEAVAKRGRHPQIRSLHIITFPLEYYNISLGILWHIPLHIIAFSEYWVSSACYKISFGILWHIPLHIVEFSRNLTFLCIQGKFLLHSMDYCLTLYKYPSGQHKIFASICWQSLLYIQ